MLRTLGRSRRGNQIGRQTIELDPLSVFVAGPQSRFQAGVLRSKLRTEVPGSLNIQNEKDFAIKFCIAFGQPKMYRFGSLGRS